MSHLIPFWTPHEHIEIWDCKCGANRHCNLCGVSTSTVPCDCDRNNPCSFYYDHKYDVLCSHCGFSIPKGEEYDPENPLCEGCQDWEEDEDLVEFGDMCEEGSYHKIERTNGLVTL